MYFVYIYLYICTNDKIIIMNATIIKDGKEVDLFDKYAKELDELKSVVKSLKEKCKDEGLNKSETTSALQRFFKQAMYND